jgi:hypothetical protein
MLRNQEILDVTMSEHLISLRGMYFIGLHAVEISGSLSFLLGMK